MFTVYTVNTRLGRVTADTRPSPFSPVYYGMQFRSWYPEQPARQITALFARPGTSKRNKDLAPAVHWDGRRNVCTVHVGVSQIGKQ